MPPVRCPHCGEYNNDTDTTCRSCHKAIVEESITCETPQPPEVSPAQNQPSSDLNDSPTIEESAPQITHTESSREELLETRPDLTNVLRSPRRRSRIYLAAFLSILLFAAAALLFSYSRIKNAFFNNSSHSIEQQSGKRNANVSTQWPKSTPKRQESSSEKTSDKPAASQDYLPGENVKGPTVVPSGNKNKEYHDITSDNQTLNPMGKQTNNGGNTSKTGMSEVRGLSRENNGVSKNNIKQPPLKAQEPLSSNDQSGKSNKSAGKKARRSTTDNSPVPISTQKSSVSKKHDVALPPEPDDNDIALPPAPDDDVALPPEPK